MLKLKSRLKSHISNFATTEGKIQFFRVLIGVNLWYLIDQQYNNGYIEFFLAGVKSFLEKAGVI